MQSSAKMQRYPQFGAFRDIPPEKKAPESVKCLKTRQIESLTALANKRMLLDVAKKFMTIDEVVTMMVRQRGTRTLQQYASELGVTNAFLCDIFKRRRNPGPKVLTALGLTERTLYERTA